MVSFGSSSEARHSAADSRPPAPAVTPPPIQTVQSTPSPVATPASKAAVLGPTLRFKGELSAEEDFILQGSLEGSITNPQNVTIGTDGSVVGNIKARIVTIDGKIEGDVYGVESVVVHATGHVVGNIYAPRVGLVEGAFFSGRIEMVDKVAQERASKSADIPTGVLLSAEETEKLMVKK
jgi:cytoskeletal protein CcmA (bactofilin family)